MKSPAKFQSRIVDIEAMQLTKENRADVLKWIPPEQVITRAWDPVNIHIANEHGAEMAEVGDWIIKGSRGEFYPCKDVTFKEKYAPQPEATQTGVGGVGAKR